MKCKLLIIIFLITTFTTKVQAQWSVDYLSQGRCFPGAVESQGQVYIAGGYLNANTGKMTNRVDIYLESINIWIIDSMTQARGDVACAALGNKLYFAGGSGDNFVNSKTVDIWDLSNNTKTVDSLLTTQAAAVPIVNGSKIYFAGGTSNTPSGVTKIVSIYDETTQTWAKDSLSLARFGHAGAKVGNIAVFGGGYTNTTNYPSTNRVDILNLSTGVWDTASLSQARGNIAAIAAGGKIFFAGGLTSTTSGILSNRVDIYDVANNSWSQANLSQARRSVAMATLGNKVYFAGGERSFSQNLASNVVDIYDFMTNTWTTDHLSLAHDALVGASVANKVIFAGGCSYKTNTYCNVIDMFTDNTLGISGENLPTNFSVYPNPCSEKLIFKEMLFDFEVYNLFGQVVIPYTKAVTEIAVNQLNEGMYVIRSPKGNIPFMVKR